MFSDCPGRGHDIVGNQGGACGDVSFWILILVCVGHYWCIPCAFLRHLRIYVRKCRTLAWYNAQGGHNVRPVVIPFFCNVNKIVKLFRLFSTRRPQVGVSKSRELRCKYNLYSLQIVGQKSGNLEKRNPRIYYNNLVDFFNIFSGFLKSLTNSR